MDKSAFLTLSAQYRDMIYRIALNFHRSIADAEDTTQEVLLKLYLRKEGFQSDAHAKHWLIQVTLNHCRSLWRSPWRRTVPLEELTASMAFEEPGQSELFLSVMALPETYRVPLYLFYYEDLSVKEIADHLNCSPTTVTTRLSRARKKLRSTLTEGADYGI